MVKAHFTNKPKHAHMKTNVLLDSEDDDYCYQIIDGYGCQRSQAEKDKMCKNNKNNW